jgi:hypothetical protein
VGFGIDVATIMAAARPGEFFRHSVGCPRLGLVLVETMNAVAVELASLVVAASDGPGG